MHAELNRVQPLKQSLKPRRLLLPSLISVRRPKSPDTDPDVGKSVSTLGKRPHEAEMHQTCSGQSPPRLHAGQPSSIE